MTQTNKTDTGLALPLAVDHSQMSLGVRALNGSRRLQVFCGALECGCRVAVSTSGRDLDDWIKRGHEITIHHSPQEIPLPCAAHRLQSANAEKIQPVDTAEESTSNKGSGS
jgi:hypothetical protein